jgi:chromosome segregation ATPase
MTQSTNNDLKNITDLLLEIKSDIKELKTEVYQIKTDVAVLKVNQDNIKEKLSTQQKSIDKIPDLIENMATVKSNQDYTKEMLSKIDGTQKAQSWSLIVAVFGIVGLLAVALFKMNSQ